MKIDGGKYQYAYGYTTEKQKRNLCCALLLHHKYVRSITVLDTDESLLTKYTLKCANSNKQPLYMYKYIYMHILILLFPIELFTVKSD